MKTIEGRTIADYSYKLGGNCYNPCIEKFKDGYVMVFRENRSVKCGAGDDRVGYAFLNSRFEIISPVRTLCLEGTHFEDPRLIKFGEHWLLFVGGPKGDPVNWRERCMYYCEVTIEFDCIRKVQVMRRIESPFGLARCEKNWVPFVNSGKLFLIYSIVPHVVLSFDFENGDTEVHSISWGGLNFPGDFISSGTPPRAISDQLFCSFFHSVAFPFDYLRNSRCISNRRLSHSRQYYMGFYIFSRKSPHRIVGYSSEPVFYKEMFVSKNERVDRPEHVVFPAGLVVNFESQSVIVSLGENDSCCKLVQFDIRDLVGNSGGKICKTRNHVHSRSIPCEFGDLS